MSIPSTQSVVQVSKPGGPEVLVDATVPVPKVEAGDVLIRVEYGGVNFIDNYLRSGLYPRPTPFTLGNELAGTVAAVGEGAKLKVGDKVAAYVGDGAYSHYKLVPAAQVATRVALLPAGVDTRTGAAVLLQGLTALTNVTEAYNVQKDDWILLPAAAGGLGTLIAQIAKHRGAHVIGTVSSEAKVQHARDSGVEHVFISTGDVDIPAEVFKLTNGKGVQAVFDGVGQATWHDALKAVARKGTIVSIGNASGAVPPLSLLSLASKNLKVVRPTLTNYVDTPEEWSSYTKGLFELLAQGAVKQSIYKDYPLSAEGVRQSQLDITSRKTIGKLLVKV